MRFSGFMIDMDGTVYKGVNKIDGADGFIAALRSRNTIWTSSSSWGST